MEKFKDIIEKIEKMSVLELHELVKVLEEKFGVSAVAVAVQSANGGAAPEAEEKDAKILTFEEQLIEKNKKLLQWEEELKETS